MELCDWGGRSIELASHSLANHRISDGGKLRFLRHVGGFGCHRKAMGAVSSAKLSAISQRAVRKLCATALAKALKVRLRRPGLGIHANSGTSLRPLASAVELRKKLGISFSRY